MTLLTRYQLLFVGTSITVAMGLLGREIRRTVVDNYELLLICLIAIAAVGGYLTYTGHVAPGTDTTTRQVSSWQSSGSFSHNATVRNGTSAFPEGEVLEDQPVYLRTVAPVLDGAFTYTYSASNESDLTASADVFVQYRSVESTQNGELVYWEVKRPLTQGTVQSLAAGERLTVPFSLNVSRAAETVRRIDSEHGQTSGRLEMAVVSQVALSGTRNGQSVDTTRTYRLPIIPRQSSYRVENAGPVPNSGDRTVEAQVEKAYGPIWTLGGPVLLLGSFSGAAALVYGRTTDYLTLTDAERRWLAYKSAREEFDDWITVGRADPVDDDVWTTSVDSLVGLVDVAIDTEERIIESDSDSELIVYTGDRLFRYAPPPEPGTDSTVGNSDAETPD
ncbi:hypothetical protein HISP_01270 [Haloarcula hispanica N601]|uniref:DUF5305 domain-containing protein n=3 Tax=Haloarcula hispanica TaxID=51589 RepID=V5THE4_HALHI|nr:conserved hypothetical protein [Haloarcula hispanica ATCC 33960]AHB64691.1 hypothetical protein HISP_01270 [Haloarcula hispanica N601]